MKAWASARSKNICSAGCDTKREKPAEQCRWVDPTNEKSTRLGAFSVKLRCRSYKTNGCGTVTIRQTLSIGSGGGRTKPLRLPRPLFLLHRQRHVSFSAGRKEKVELEWWVLQESTYRLIAVFQKSTLHYNTSKLSQTSSTVLPVVSSFWVFSDSYNGR